MKIKRSITIEIAIIGDKMSPGNTGEYEYKLDNIIECLENDVNYHIIDPDNDIVYLDHDVFDKASISCNITKSKTEIID